MSHYTRDVQQLEEADLREEVRGILEAAAQAVGRQATDLSAVEKAVALHDFVRDEILFGWNDQFDAATPRFTLGSEVSTAGFESCISSGV